ncbi:hypothetical protein DXG01_004675 [Tephrocybe rancida]|nr:hypothetical protein DXG01_004675 [Tephrocybe rancida]
MVSRDPRPLRWQSTTGKDTIQHIIKALIPQWKDGLYDWQLDLVSQILDGGDVLISTATGDGKLAVFAAPLIILLEIQERPLYYPNLPYREFPMGIVISPTKGLASNIVSAIGKYQ